MKSAGLGALSLGAKALGPQAPKGINFDPKKEFGVLREFLGDQALPAATEKELITLVNTPLKDLTTQLSFQSDKTFRRINDSFDRQIQGIKRQFTQAGQNTTNSGDVRNEIARIEQMRSETLGEAEQELANENLSRGIQAKQFALTKSIEQSNFDDNLALELADAMGQKAAYEAAIQQNDSNKFQEIMSGILTLGFG